MAEHAGSGRHVRPFPIISTTLEIHNPPACANNAHFVTHIDTLIELFDPEPIKEPVPLSTDPAIPQWKYNLKNQWPDLPEAA